MTFSDKLQYNPYYPFTNDGSLLVCFDMKTFNYPSAVTNPNKLRDLSLNNNDGTLVGSPTLHSDGIQGFSVSNRITFPNPFQSAPTAFTIEVDCLPTEGIETTIHVGGSTNVSISSDATPNWSDSDGTNTLTLTRKITSKVPVVRVLTSANNGFTRSYWNGQLDKMASIGILVSWGAGGLLPTIGSNPDGTSPFQGKIRRVRIWNRELSYKEVMTLSSLQLMRQFPENSGEMFYTSSGERWSWSGGSQTFANEEMKIPSGTLSSLVLTEEIPLSKYGALMVNIKSPSGVSVGIDMQNDNGNTSTAWPALPSASSTSYFKFYLPLSLVYPLGTDFMQFDNRSVLRASRVRFNNNGGGDIFIKDATFVGKVPSPYTDSITSANHSWAAENTGIRVDENPDNVLNGRSICTTLSNAPTANKFVKLTFTNPISIANGITLWNKSEQSLGAFSDFIYLNDVNNNQISSALGWGTGWGVKIVTFNYGTTFDNKNVKSIEFGHPTITGAGPRFWINGMVIQ